MSGTRRCLAAGPQVLRIDKSGKTNKVYIKRRDLLRRNRLLPRDLRRIDPSLSVVKTSPSINIKDHALLINVGGVRYAHRPAAAVLLWWAAWLSACMMV